MLEKAFETFTRTGGSTARRVIIASGVGPVAPVKKSAPTRRSASPARSRTSKPKASKGRLLWIGDAAVPTGFATVTHSVLAQLHRRWDVTVSGVNYEGAEHDHPYRILPAWQGGDMWGMNRFADLCAEFAPDVIVINNDWWNVAGFLQRAPRGARIVAYMPVDGVNLDRKILPKLNRLTAAVWYTDFGHREAVKAGFKGTRHVLPHGLDTRLFRPVDRAEARRALGLPEDAFIVGNVNRNQPRKRLDATIEYFAAWVKQHRVKNARLLLHCAKRDAGWDLESLARHHGVGGRVIFTGPDELDQAADASLLPMIYSSLDVQVSTTLGEGWGLTTMEGMACGVPQIVPDWAALGEWAEPAIKVPCSTRHAHTGISTIGALPDKAAFMAALNSLYRDEALRRDLSRRGQRFVKQPCFRWANVAGELEAVLERAMRGKTKRAGMLTHA